MATPEPTPTMITIHKLDSHGKELWKYIGRLLEQDKTRVVLEAEFNRDDVDIEGLALRRGDRFIEYFFFDRWYNIFQVFEGNTQHLKGWYCNITRPAWMEAHDLYAEDLALDLVVLPDKQLVLVDQDDFEALDLPRIERKLALAGLDELIELARSAEGPFKPTGPTYETG